MVVIHGDRDQLPDLTCEVPVSIVYLDEENHPTVMSGEEYLIHTIADRAFHVSASSFFQTNPYGCEKLVETVKEMVTASGAQILLDVYCGVGLFSACLANQVEKIIGIESSSSACEDFAINLREFSEISLYQGDAGLILEHLNEQPNCVIVDPPRSGLNKKTIRGLLRLSPKTLLYVSCNPATLARDIIFLQSGGYHLVETRLVDMFPQTYHIESVNLFKRF